MKPNTISLNILVDNSRFMVPHAGETATSLERLLAQYREYKAMVSYSMFSDLYDPIYVDTPINEVELLPLQPDGQSSLLESACRMIDDVGARLAALPEEERPAKVVFAILTSGQDSVSGMNYPKELLQEKIRHQTDVYNWCFLFPVIDFPLFHPTVVRLHEPIKRNTFQFTGNLDVPQGETTATVFKRAIDCVYEWIDLKLGASTPDRKRFEENFEFDQFILPTLKVAAMPEEGHWCVRMVHADEPAFNRPAIAGLTWTSDIALSRENDIVRFAMRVFVTASLNADGVLPIRPRLISDIGRRIGLSENLPLSFEQCGIIENEKDIKRFVEAIKSPRRQIPVILLAGENNGELQFLIFERQPLGMGQSVRYFAYVILLPESWRGDWTREIGEDLTLPFGGARIYYPFSVTPGDPSVNHPCYTPEEIDSWRWSFQFGKAGFALYLKEKLSEYAATKPVDWGRCLFYPRASSRLMELRREQLSNLPDKEYVLLLEEDSAALALLKKEIEEKEGEIKRLERERFELKQRLDHQYRPQPFESEKPVSSTKISVFALDQLKKINGRQREQIDGMIDSVSDESWRRLHSHRFTKTDLSVYKDGLTNPAWIAGFFDDGVFHVTHVFCMQHGDYERILNKCQRRDVEELEFTLWEH